LYFLTSTDKIRAFLETNASKAVENGDDPEKPKHIFNKIGHALHVLNPLFKKHTFSDQVKVKKKWKFNGID
jgi:phytanoyl-CoA hydroxylase